MTDIPDKPSPANISNAVEGSGLAVSVDWNSRTSAPMKAPVTGENQLIEVAI